MTNADRSGGAFAAGAVGPPASCRVPLRPAPKQQALWRALTSGAKALGPWQPVPNLFSVTSVTLPGPTTGWLLGPKAGATNADAIVTSDGGRTWHEQLRRPVDRPGQW